MKRYTVFALFLALASTVVRAQTAVFARRSLKGVTEVRVVVADIDPAAEEAGLLRTQLMTDVALRLRQSHIKVSEAAVGDTSLFVDVNLYKIREFPNWAYDVQVTYNQPVTVERNKAVGPAETWRSANAIGIIGSGDLASKIRQTVGDWVDQFINDYLAANQ